MHEFSLTLRFVPADGMLHLAGAGELAALVRYVQPLLLSLPSLPSLTPAPSVSLPVAPSKGGKIADRSHKKKVANKEKETSCNWCGDTFTGRPGQKFCSSSCSAKHARHSQQEKATTNGAFPLPRIETSANLQ